MGIHNKNPDYMYKPGNQFGEYLGSGEGGHRVTPRPPRQGQNGKNRSGDPEQEALVAFVQRILTGGERQDWLKRATSEHDVTPPSELHEYHRAAWVIRELPPKVCASYLAELKKHREAARSQPVARNSEVA